MRVVVFVAVVLSLLVANPLLACYGCKDAYSYQCDCWCPECIPTNCGYFDRSVSQSWYGDECYGNQGCFTPGKHCLQEPSMEGLRARDLREAVTIVGTVIDAETGQPIPQSMVHVRVLNARNGSAMSTRNSRSGNDGTFRVAGVSMGESVEIFASAAGYPPDGQKVTSFEKPVTVRVRPAVLIPQQIVDENGHPLPGAKVEHFEGDIPRGISYADGNGWVMVPVVDGKPHRVVVSDRAKREEKAAEQDQ